MNLDETIIAIGKAVNHTITVNEAKCRLYDAQIPECGSCYWWMKKECPREAIKKVSMSDFPCHNYLETPEHVSLVASLRKKVQEAIEGTNEQVQG